MKCPFLRLPWLLLVCLPWAFIYAQPGSSPLHGIVRDATSGEALRGVSIEAESALYGTISNNNGEFSLILDAERAVGISLSRTGYLDKHITLAPSDQPVEIKLRKDNGESAATPAMLSEATFRLNLLRKLIDLTTWPESPTDAPFVIGIIGSNPFGDDLYAFEALTFGGHRTEIAFLRSADDIGPQQVLYICKANRTLMKEIHQQLQGKAILSLSDRCAEEGFHPVISLFKVEDNIVFKAHAHVAKAAGIVLNPAVYKISHD